MTVQRRILLAAILWTLISLVAGLHVFLRLNNLITLQKSSSHIQLVLAGYERIFTILIGMETGIRGYLLSGDDAYLEPFNEAEGLFDGEAKALLELIKDNPLAQNELKSIIELKNQWIGGPVMEDMLARRKLNRGMMDHAAFAEVFKRSQSKAIMDRIRAQIRPTQSNLRTDAEKIGAEVIARAQTTQISTAISLILSIIIGFAALAAISRSISRQVNTTVNVLEGLSKDIGKASEDVSKTSSALTQSSEQVSVAVGQTSDSVEIIYSATARTSAEAQASRQLLNDCMLACKVGIDSVDHTMSAIRNIQEQNSLLSLLISENNQRMRESVKLIESIAGKTNMIHEIVFQTKLLSFNASVEAARAGEHGRGFAIVASEVGNLAAMSGKSAREISEIVSMSIKHSNDLVTALGERSEFRMREFSEKVAQSIHHAEASAINLAAIREKVAIFSNYLTHLVEATEAQSAGISNIRSVMKDVDGFTLANDHVSKEAAEVAIALTHHIATLQNTVCDLNKIFKPSVKSLKEAA